MPDLDIRELLDGVRRSEQMNKKMKETVLKIADDNNEEKLYYTKRLHVWFKLTLISFIVYFVSLFVAPETPSAVFDFAQGLMLGIALAMIIIGVLMTGKNGHKLQETKMQLLGKTLYEE